MFVSRVKLKTYPIFHSISIPFEVALGYLLKRTTPHPGIKEEHGGSLVTVLSLLAPLLFCLTLLSFVLPFVPNTYWSLYSHYNEYRAFLIFYAWLDQYFPKMYVRLSILDLWKQKDCI